MYPPFTARMARANHPPADAGGAPRSATPVLLGNPLEALTNLIYLVGLRVKELQTREYLHLAQQELERISRITKQTLAFSRESAAPITVSVPELVWASAQGRRWALE